MRWNEIINESAVWDLAGFWITNTGERINVDHNKGIHHANIAVDEFLEYLDLTDFEPIDSYDDRDNMIWADDILDMAVDAAFDEGWVRVSTSGQEIDVTFWKLNRNSLISLRKHLTNEQPVSTYVLDHVAEFGSLKELFRKLNEIYHTKHGVIKKGT